MACAVFTYHWQGVTVFSLVLFFSEQKSEKSKTDLPVLAIKGRSIIRMTLFPIPNVETCYNIRPDQIFEFKAAFEILTVVRDLLRIPISFYFPLLVFIFNYFKSYNWILIVFMFLTL